MINQTETEYDAIKVLREISLLRKLNAISHQLVQKTGSRENGKGLFVPELIEVITTKGNDRLFSKRPSSYGGAKSGETKASSNLDDKFQHVDLKTINDDVNLHEICLVMEFLESDLDQLLKCKIDFSVTHLLKIVYHSLCSLAFLHEANVMHRDLKSSNILITADCNAKICDFGLSRSIPQTCSDLKGFNSLFVRDQALGKLKKAANKDKAMEQYIENKLHIDQKRRQTLKRTVSIHDGSRWYRAPEVCLIER